MQKWNSMVNWRNVSQQIVEVEGTKPCATFDSEGGLQYTWRYVFETRTRGYTQARARGVTRKRAQGATYKRAHEE